MEDINRSAYDKMAAKWSKEYWEKDVSDKINKFLLYLKKGKDVIDIGCGPGRDVGTLMRCGLNVTGIDFSESMLEEARKRVPSGNFLLMDFNDLKFPNNTFDGAWAFASLIHLPKDKLPLVLSQIHRILRPGGVLAAAFKAGHGESDMEKEGTKRHFSFYGEKGLRDALIAAGFDVKESYKEKETNNEWIIIFCLAEK